jgi:ureidoglycolate lyase
MKLEIGDLTPEAFAAFGQVVRQPQGAAQVEGPGWQYWGGLAQAPGEGYAVGYLDLAAGPELRFDWAERHAASHEMLVPTADVVIHVAPPDYPAELARLPDLARFRLFRVRPGEAVVLHPNVWHGAPLALGERAKVVVLLKADVGPTNSAVVQFSGDVIEAA